MNNLLQMSITSGQDTDPLSEKYYAISPYAYCAGNPVNLVDPEGPLDFNYLQKELINNPTLYFETVKKFKFDYAERINGKTFYIEGSKNR